MALYAIGDLHLSFSTDKPMEVFGWGWRNHVARIEKHWKKRIRPEDTVVVTGDHSWGHNLEECAADLAWIEALPGRKILLRGNHDMFWDAKKTARLNALYEGRLEFLQNNYYVYEDNFETYALVGTKGYCYEGKSPNGLLDSIEHFEKIRDRELARLQVSFQKAAADGYTKFLMFLHYPPTSIGEPESCFTRLAEQYGASKVIYSHCHGIARFQDSFLGEVNGIEYKLVSSDYLKFKPERIL